MSSSVNSRDASFRAGPGPASSPRPWDDSAARRQTTIGSGNTTTGRGNTTTGRGNTTTGRGNTTTESADTSTARGDAAESLALAHLQRAGLVLEARHYRIGGGPHRPAAEIDLVMRAPDGTLVFVEVRARRHARQGGAAASVGLDKRLRIARAAQHYLRRFASPPPCRFDVVAVDGGRLRWLPAAFDAEGAP